MSFSGFSAGSELATDVAELADAPSNGAKYGGSGGTRTHQNWFCRPVPRPLRRSIHRVSRSLPRLDSAFQHLDVRKALRLIFRCLTDSTRFAGSSSIENDFPCLRQ